MSQVANDIETFTLSKSPPILSPSISAIGWDFAHKNYQDFFSDVAKSPGENIYFVKYKGSKGGPSIEKLVGRHLGSRLVIGEVSFMSLSSCWVYLLYLI